MTGTARPAQMPIDASGTPAERTTRPIVDEPRRAVAPNMVFVGIPEGAADKEMGQATIEEENKPIAA